MKGFPNQIADLRKLAKGMKCLVQLKDKGDDARDDSEFGLALVREGVAGTGHIPISVSDYIQQQRKRPPSKQSFRTTARGLRELYRILGFIDDSGAQLQVTVSGRQVASFDDSPLGAERTEFWRRVVRGMTHDGGDGESSHPYQVLLNLVARKPGITRAKCALALEARNDSGTELDRIVDLVDLGEGEICGKIGVTISNWNNAKKVLPKFAEQLGDIVRTGQSYRLADVPKQADALRQADAALAPIAKKVLSTRASREVTPASIARVKTVENFDETGIPIDPIAAAASIRVRQDRLRRHQLIVQNLAGRLGAAGAVLFEDPFDIFALFNDCRFLVEVKTLDGTSSDERDRVRDALGQLLYYESFAPAPGETDIVKIACFERTITTHHHKWLNKFGIAVVWMSEGHFVGDTLAAASLSAYLEEIS